jgi:peptidoglycan/xylan/chitin deacetylase (PgdA/CDA1 family)
VVIYYHSIPSDQQAAFAKQLDVILKYSKVVRNTADGATQSNADTVLVTFDDGFENFLMHALPELQKRNVPSTVFIISGGLDRSFGSEAYSEKLLSLEQILQLPQNLVTIGSHTVNHPMLTRLSSADARSELKESRVALETMLQQEVKEFSFPFGDFNQELVEICKEVGYARVFTTLPESTLMTEDAFVVGRVRVDPPDWPVEFRLKIAGAYRWLPAVFSWKRAFMSWLKPHQPRLAQAEPRSSIR